MTKKLVVILLAALFMSSCVSKKMYKGYRLGRQHTAAVHAVQAGRIAKFTKAMGGKYNPGGALRIMEIDGQTAGYSKHVEVMPGWHDFILHYSRGRQYIRCPIGWASEPGKDYKAVAVETGVMNVIFWVEETLTRKVVAGKRPSLFDPKRSR